MYFFQKFNIIPNGKEIHRRMHEYWNFVAMNRKRVDAKAFILGVISFMLIEELDINAILFLDLLIGEYFCMIWYWNLFSKSLCQIIILQPWLIFFFGGGGEIQY